jgi:hypothetical protein
MILVLKRAGAKAPELDEASSTRAPVNNELD